MKRFFDLFFSFLVLLISWPLLIIIGILIKISSPGPVIFKQKRIGKNGQAFTLYKFRTMAENAEKVKKKYLSLNEVDGPVFKIHNDPRFIGPGRFLAHTGLDELPNFFNVLKNDLSLVGPRPLPVDEASRIPSRIKKIRESVQPGITSSWVISGAHRLSFRQWLELDRKYVKKHDLAMDLKILFLTGKMVAGSIMRNLRG